MGNKASDARYVRKCRRRAKFEKIKYSLYWIVPLVILLLISMSIIYYMSVKTTWQKFSMHLAKDVSYASGEDSLRAIYGDEDVRLHYNNGVNLYNMILDADVTGALFRGSDEKAIHIEFGNGNTVDIININDDRCFLMYRGEKNYNFKIGVQGMFSKFVRITSLEGGNYPNEPFETAVEPG